jgi:hypothetical protein
MKLKQIGSSRVLSLLAAISLAACSGGSGTDNSSGLAIPPHNIVSTSVDPVGDAIAAAGVAWDITQVQTTLVEGPFRNEYLTLQVAVTFSQDVSAALPPPGQPLIGHPERLGVEILLNTDGSDATGLSEAACSASPSVTGIDAFVDSGAYGGRNLDGSFAILDTAGLKRDDAPVSVTGHTVTYSINLAAWGSPSTGIQKTKVLAIAFNGFGESGIETDCAPNSGAISVSGN